MGRVVYNWGKSHGTRIKLDEIEVTSEEIGEIITWDEMQCLELKESLSVKCIETACALANKQD